MNNTNPDAIKDKVLVVDDDVDIRQILALTLGDYFDVKTVDSGEECLQGLDEFQPKLVILDIDMPGINGYETCRKLRVSNKTLPVIFLSGHDTLDERLEAFDSGGNDFLTKPAEHKLVLRKAQMTIKAKEDHDRIESEKASYEHMAMTFLDTMGDSGVIQNFMRANIDCPDYAMLLDRLLEATRLLSLECHIQMRYPGGSLSVTPLGKAEPLVESVLTQVASLGRLFQFKKRLVTNFEHITIIIMNMPEDPEIVGRVRDNIAILAEVSDAIVKVIELRNESAARAERVNVANKSARSAIDTLRDKYRHQQVETRLLQEKLIREVESTYIHLGLLDSQEHTISDVLHKNTEEILGLFEQSVEFERQFAIILDSLGTN